MVNTFLPYSNFKQIAKVLDNKRLGKQRVEAKQIIDIITGAAKYTAWGNHPVVKQWRGYPDALKLYYNTMIDEWVKRGYVNHMPKFQIPRKIVMPWFVKCAALHMSHRASLLRKLPEHYSKYFNVPEVYKQYSYIWAGNLSEEYIKELKKIKSDAELKNIKLERYAKLHEQAHKKHELHDYIVQN